MRPLARVLLAASALLLSGAAASAQTQTATVMNLLNVRSGPGPDFPVIGQVPGGASVMVLGCTPSWCSINGPQPSFVAAAFLAFNGRVPYVNGGPMLVGPVPTRGMPGPMAPGPFFGVGVWYW